MDAMIATAVFPGDIEKILDAGAAAVDPKSTMSRVIADVRQWARENPKDWRVTRRLTKDRYCRYGGEDLRARDRGSLEGASPTSAPTERGRGFFQNIPPAVQFWYGAGPKHAATP